MKKKILFILTFMLLFVGCTKPNYAKLEKEMTELAGKYYKEQLEGKVMGLNNHLVSLEALELAGYDIKNFTNKKCDPLSYSIVVLELDENREVVGDYKVENHLTCGDYQTPEKK